MTAWCTACFSRRKRCTTSACAAGNTAGARRHILTYIFNIRHVNSRRRHVCRYLIGRQLKTSKASFNGMRRDCSVQPASTPWRVVVGVGWGWGWEGKRMHASPAICASFRRDCSTTVSFGGEHTVQMQPNNHQTHGDIGVRCKAAANTHSWSVRERRRSLSNGWGGGGGEEQQQRGKQVAGRPCSLNHL